MHISRSSVRGLRVRRLESRRLLSVAPSPVAGTSEFGFPLSELTTQLGNLVGSSDTGNAPHESGQTSLPAVPFDDSISPVTDVPDLDHEIRVPGDANGDGAVDFMDFLLLRQHFGDVDATWSQGDFTGDGRVGFDDLLVLSSGF